MKRMALFFLSILLVLVAFGFARAQIPKEGTGSFVAAFSGTYKTVPMGQERVQMAYEVIGPIITGTSEPILQNASVRCVGSLHAIKGAYEDDSGFCVYTRPDGNQVFKTYKPTGHLGASSKGRFIIVGGTGKLTGIQGDGEFIRIGVRPAAEGTFQSYNRVKYNYKLP